MKRKISIICFFVFVLFAGCTPQEIIPSDRSAKVEDNITEDAATEDITVSNKTSLSEESATDIPPYSGKSYIELNNNVPAFTDEEKKSTEAFEHYSNLDHLGRCGVAYANVCRELMPTEERGRIGDIRPSGWHTVKYPDLIEDNYLYNRSHLIAYSLAGENDNEKNLITGTRYFNQETMQIFELKVLDYVRANDNHVLYRVTPVFENDNLLATGVIMEAWSVEDEGSGICFNVFCYNVQPGIEIDYATGESKRAESSTASDNAATSDSDLYNTKMSFILNTHTKKIHMPGCRGVKQMADRNKLECESTINELIKQGYEPCKMCLEK
jgi:DNA-entry nuclease